MEYIEREAALKEFEKVCNVCMALVNKPMCGDCSVADTVRKVKSIPAADVRPVVRARWVKMKFFPDWECERCGSVISGNTPDPWNHYHFCPNCGADTREES